MRVGDFARLIALAAIWGAAFVFIRVTAPVLGPVWTAEGRLVIGAASLLVWFHFARIDASWRHVRFYLVIGCVGTALPFTLLGFAGMHVPASVMAVLNATTPMMVLLLSSLFRLERITAARGLGMLLGIAGVWLLAGTPAPGTAKDESAYALAIAACLCVAFIYAGTAILVKRLGPGIPSKGLALGTQVCGALWLVPALPLALPAASPDALVWGNLIALGVLSSGLAYILYFRLIEDIGPTRTQTVSFLIPVFGTLCGVLFLGETLSPGALIGALSIIVGVVLVTVTGRQS